MDQHLVAVIQHGEAAINEDTQLLRNDTVLEAATPMGAAEGFAVEVPATSEENIRSKAPSIDRVAQVDASGNIMDAPAFNVALMVTGIAEPASRDEVPETLAIVGEYPLMIRLRIQPIAFDAEAEIAMEEIIQSNATTPAVITHERALMRLGNGISSEYIGLELTVAKARGYLRGRLVLLGRRYWTGEAARRHRQTYN